MSQEPKDAINLEMRATAYLACNPIEFTEWRDLFSDKAHYNITIEWRRPMYATVPVPLDRVWAICQRGWVLNRDGDWEYEPLPSSRDDEFKARTRYRLSEAKGHLQRCMPQIISELLHELKMRHGSPEKVRQERGT